MELLQWDTGTHSTTKFYIFPVAKICKKSVTIWKQIRIVMLDQEISNFKTFGISKRITRYNQKSITYTQTQTLVSPRTRSDPEVLRRCQGHGQLRSRRLVATRAEHDRSIHAERQALWLVGGWCFRGGPFGTMTIGTIFAFPNLPSVGK